MVIVAGYAEMRAVHSVKGAPAENIAKTTYATSYWQTQLAADEVCMTVL